MYELERITLHNWNLFEAVDIEVLGQTAFVGPTGAGKSSIIDAIQTIVTGFNSRHLELNESAGGQSDRTVQNYCLGLDDAVSTDPLRPRCETLLALAFRDTGSGEALSIVLMLEADAADSKPEVAARLVIRGHSFRIADHLTGDGDELIVPTQQTILHRLEATAGRERVRRHHSAARFVEDYLTAMRKRGAAPDPEQYIRNFANAVAFKHIDDSTKFVRRHILPPAPLNVENVRRSIANWRELGAVVQRIEESLAGAQAARGRLITWARQAIQANTLRFSAAYAETRRLTFDLRDVDAELATIADRAASTEREAEAARAELNTLAQRHTDLRVRLAASAGSNRRAALEAEIRALDHRRLPLLRDAGDQLRLAANIANLQSFRHHFPASAQPALEAALRVKAALPSRPGKDDLNRLGADAAKALAACEAMDSLAAQRDALVEDRGGLRRDIEEAREALAAAEDGRALLSPEVRRFRALLKQQGIEATALPDVVEIRDPDWAMALEMLLGPNREALIVEPARLGEAYDLLYRSRREHSTVRLVNLGKARAAGKPLPSGSIASIIEIDDADARAFIERQVGRFVMADTRADLDRFEHAVMRDGRTSSGAALSVHRDLRPLLGKTAREENLAGERDRIAELERRAAATERTIRALQTAIEQLTLARTAREQTTIGQAVAELDALDAEITGLHAEIEAIDDPEARRLEAEMGEVARRAETVNSDLDRRILPQARRIAGEREAATDRRKRIDYDLTRTGEDLRRAQEAEAVPPLSVILPLIENASTIAAARAAIDAVANGDGEDPRRGLAERRNADRRELEGGLLSRIDENARIGTSLYHKYVNERLVEEVLNRSADEAAKLLWLDDEVRRLETNELIPYKAKVEEARVEVETALKEDLLTKLADKFGEVRRQIDQLNRRLARHTFTGQTYRFSHGVDPSLHPLYLLATQVSQNPGIGLFALVEEGDDQRLRDAMAKVDEILATKADTRQVEDYRNYFVFELEMTSETGVKTSLSRRSGSGSGGQKQAPYYVAIAASMAAACYPGSSNGAHNGMGLVVFDEAFSKLDTANTRALLRFFKELGLQVLIAAPEQKRADFLETVDTIVSVSRPPSKDEIYVHVENPGPRARHELALANPVKEPAPPPAPKIEEDAPEPKTEAQVDRQFELNDFDGADDGDAAMGQTGVDETAVGKAAGKADDSEGKEAA